jgi:hypothetical protein
MRRTLVAITAAALGLAPAAGLADEPTYPEQVYTAVSPSSADWLALFSPDGRWAIQVGDGCPTIASGMGMNVLLTAAVEDDAAALVVPDSARFGAGESCPITARIWQSAVPCAQHDGVCDVAYDT